jgi:8-oxo-dGTP pyrophosphatase MutT (NUDIX family)
MSDFNQKREGYQSGYRRYNQKVQSHHECCAGACVFKNKDFDEVLIVRDRWNNWSFPKGHFEKEDSTALDCAKREVLEETKVEFYQVIESGIHYEEVRSRRSYAPRGKIIKHVILFVGIKYPYFEPQPDESEILEAKFVKVGEAKELIKNDSLQIALETIIILVKYSFPPGEVSLLEKN